jgi:dTDP-3-amino-2,3,6-trideoxy-4-keto-D-glucose/dTDP-3-amino-3,4,6-trideoxy-alpha-D-glucose/dTDP-2,6-dideoxy-D-kanosamine transaminase
VATPKVRYSPLPQQFADIEHLIAEIRSLVATGDFTLGAPVAAFEESFARLMGATHAIGVGTGTDALKLPLKALGIGPGDQVLTCANTFVATVGAIAELGATPVFVDCTDTFCMDLTQVEAAITPRTRAIMPVHLTGEMVDMPQLIAIAERRGLPVVEDACQGMLSELDGRKAGSWGVAAGFSMHPLKLINVWGDAGVVVTNDDRMARTLRLLRNHGLRNRDEIEILGCNTRLDSLQAIVGRWMIGQARDIARLRAERAAYYDRAFAGIGGVRIPPRRSTVKHTYLLYVLFADRRDELLRHCLNRGIEAKVHYPIPLYCQPALAQFGYKAGDFPVTDRHAREMITFPVDQHLSAAEQDYVVRTVAEFYGERAAN